MKMVTSMKLIINIEDDHTGDKRNGYAADGLGFTCH